MCEEGLRERERKKKERERVTVDHYECYNYNSSIIS